MSRILITDDSQLTRRILKTILEADGHDVMEASSGGRALEIIADQAPDCILLDLLMPDTDGFQVLDTLNKKRISVPVIVITADIQETARQRCIQLGAFDFLNKPPKDKELVAAVQKALASRKARCQ